MARIGLSDLHYAPISEDANGNEIYGTPRQIAGAINADISISYTETLLHADGQSVDAAAEFDSGSIRLNISDIPPRILKDLIGGRRDDNNVYLQSQGDTSAPVAIAFRSKKADGGYRYVWLYRVVFRQTSESHTSDGEAITFSTDSIEGRIYRRNKADYAGEHPWRAFYDTYRPVIYTTNEILAQSGQAMLAQANQSPQDVLNLARGLNQESGNNPANTWFEAVYEPYGISGTDMAEEMTNNNH